MIITKKTKAPAPAPKAVEDLGAPEAPVAFIAPEIRPNTPAVEVAMLLQQKEWAEASK